VQCDGNALEALDALDRYAVGADFVLGHNLIAFDAPHLAAVHPELRLLRKPMIDTLWLNPIAFPRNPYHHLVKHYQDGRLQGGHLSDPELDAKLVLTVLSNQVEALREIERSTPDTTRAYHYLSTTQPAHSGSTRCSSWSGPPLVRSLQKPSVPSAGC
jgi:ATP-dependent DNA helicase RecQ